MELPSRPCSRTFYGGSPVVSYWPRSAAGGRLRSGFRTNRIGLDRERRECEESRMPSTAEGVALAMRVTAPPRTFARLAGAVFAYRLDHELSTFCRSRALPTRIHGAVRHARHH